MQKKQYTPMYRFPSFNDSWKSEKIGGITERVTNAVDVNPKTFYQEIGIRSHGKGLFHKEFITGKALGNKRVFWVKENVFIVNIVFAWEQAVAKTTSKEVGMIASHRFPMYEPVQEKIDLDFLLYLFLTKKGKYLLEMASPGGAGRNKTLGQKAFDELKVRIPSLDEQLKISKFLVEIDELGNAVKQKIDLLKQYKKSVTQRIFSGDIRFKDSDGSNFTEWEINNLGAILSIPEKEKPAEVCRDKIFTVKLHLKGLHKSKNTKNLSLGATYYLRKKGQFIFGKQNLFNGAFGIIPDKFDGWLTSGDIPALDINEEKVVPEYLMQFLGREWYYKKLEAISNGTGSKRIHEKTFLGIKIKLPSVNEQVSISKFLKNIDVEINSFQLKLQKINKYKSGLLQTLYSDQL